MWFNYLESIGYVVLFWNPYFEFDSALKESLLTKYKTNLFSLKKGRDLTPSHDESPCTHRKLKKAK